MGKNKLKKFGEMELFSNVFQCGYGQAQAGSTVLQMRGQWGEQFFHNNHPITLELGCGHGEYTVGLAQQNPERNYIGIDIKGARIWAGAKQALQDNLSNVAFLRTHIEMLPLFFAPNEVNELWITFPDPQMNKVTKRLTSTYFMQRYQQIMPPDGHVHLKTDSPFLYAYTKAMLQDNKLCVLADTDNLYQDNLALYPDASGLQTHYERQWLDRGMTIKYLCWKLSDLFDWIEPTIEIEKDNYRSYGRNYQVIEHFEK